MLEAEFIYDMNRLNVALTRARTKTVMLISKALLDASPHVLENERASQGLSYMRKLEDLVRNEGFTTEMTVKDVQLEILAL